VDVVQERLAWDLPEEQGRVPLSHCSIGPDTAPVRLGGDLPTALAAAAADVRFLHVASHGGGSGLGQYLLLPERLLAAQALAMKWPESVLMASCHVGRLVNPEDAEPLNFVMALLTGGSRCVVAGLDEIPDVRTSRMTAQIVDAVRDAPVRLDVALREVQLAYRDVVKPTWALLAAYVR
ncbi:MAG TPA: CHAT domain-containing protein, partial [Micromonospora sp.]